MRLNKKSQSEAVGFVIIILIVIIVGTIFLGIFLRQDKTVSVQDAEIANFLSASKGYTTECFKDSEPSYRTLEDLTKDCNDRRAIICPNNAKTCDSVNKTYSEMVARFLPAGTFAYYRISIVYQEATNETEALTDLGTSSILTPIRGHKIIEDIIWGDQTKCTARRTGRGYIAASNGNIIIELEICRVS